MIQRIGGGVFDSNVFVVGDDRTCVVIDAGVELDRVAAVVAGRKVLALLLTHGHFDHSAFCLQYAQCFGCKIFGSVNLKKYLKDPSWNYSGENNFVVDDFSDFKFLRGNGVLKFENLQIEFFSLGGHTTSDMCFQVGNDIFVGDLLIGRSMGKIDLLGGDKKVMKKSLEFLLNQPFLIMHSGHGEDNEKKSQDFVAKQWIKFLSR